ncbi:hypothetical protein DI09_61p140 [Mitosporidium daphniae]|uniref:RNA helicase n=1 Tax=Mitosporidium daphniae TaxID=1485682 RepID=A0A098VNH4_9MICR|nr:uncharacterized protein DI09_61p140 [Mitosporidium daphniae]KGG50627.1 hypothetical protein DI09_61p140 [Mitosporidium daphniae]|eukprot:XP_013237054.1 uncharacterized protein DI09_61p140 [Mitosporidium daphniae]
MSLPSFAELSLDICLEKALLKAGYLEPTPIQAHGLPIILKQNLDIFVHAKTGSGKTLLYVLPILKECLQWASAVGSQKEISNQGIRGIILVPTRDLAQQVLGVFNSIMRYCPNEIQLVNLCADSSELFKKSLLSLQPSIVLSTPSLLCKFINNKAINLNVACFKYFVIDEADFILGIGYQNDLDSILAAIPQTCTRILLSATLDEEIDCLKKKFLSKPLQEESHSEESTQKGSISHFFLHLDTIEDKFLLTLVLFKFKLISGRILIFTNSSDTAYRLKLFLEAFYIKACVLNGELPFTSRYNIIEEANRGKFDCIIAVDQVDLKPKKPQKLAEDEFGVSRGIDFKGLSVVINFDIPTTVKAYCHRAGRTGRNIAHGTTLSLKSDSEASDFEGIVQFLKKHQVEMKPFLFDIAQVEGLRYRAMDVLSGITANCLNESKVNDLKNHISISEKLKNHFEANPLDLKSLRQDKDLRSKKNKSHLKHIPDYLLSTSARGISLPKLDSEFKYSLSKTTAFSATNHSKLKKKRLSRDPLRKIK